MIHDFRILFIAAALGVASVAQADQKAYGPESLAKIEQEFSGEPFLLVLWELSCPPCHGEMAMLGRLRQEHPGMNLVLVGTDPVGMEEEVADVLARHGLTGVNSWLFANENKERLRYSIDPEWYGELPRNYFYDADGQRTGISGKLDEARVREWLAPRSQG